jgi:hypothetical protein
MRLACGTTLLAATLALSGCTGNDAGKQSQPRAMATLTVDDRLALDLAKGLAARVTGEVTSAAYVVGTYQGWQGSPGRRGLPTTHQIAPTDKVLVVKIFGDFVSNHSRPAGASVGRDSQAVIVFNATQSRGVMSGFGGGMAPHGNAVEDPQLVALGSPQAISLNMGS